MWRYPVKSLQGEPLAEAMLSADGLDGDCRYAIFGLDTASATNYTLSGRRAAGRTAG